MMRNQRIVSYILWLWIPILWDMLLPHYPVCQSITRYFWHSLMPLRILQKKDRVLWLDVVPTMHWNHSRIMYLYLFMVIWTLEFIVSPDAMTGVIPRQRMPLSRLTNSVPAIITTTPVRNGATSAVMICA